MVAGVGMEMTGGWSKLNNCGRATVGKYCGIKRKSLADKTKDLKDE